MIKLKAYALTATRTAATPAAREIVLDQQQKRVYIGDGTTLGGLPYGAADSGGFPFSLRDEPTGTMSYFLGFMGDVGDNQFAAPVGSPYMTWVYLGPSCTSIGSRAFENQSALYQLSMADTITSIGSYAFSNASSLYEINLSSSLTSIGSQAFQNSSISAIQLPDSVTSLADGAFEWMTMLGSVSLGKGVTSIPDAAFRYCFNLSSVSYTGAITSIGVEAFSSCGALASFTFPNITTISTGAFRGTWLGAVNLPASVTAIGSYAFYYVNPLAEASGPNVTSIADSAFRSCYNLSSIDFPNLQVIGAHAFNSTAITSLNLPDLTFIGAEAFSYSKIAVVDLPLVEAVGAGAFYVSPVSTIILPAATEISEAAFSGAAMEIDAYLNLPTSMISWPIFDQAPTSFSQDGFPGVGVSSDGQVVMTTDVANLYRSTDGGATMVKVGPSGMFNAVAISGNGQVMYATEHGGDRRIVVSTDSGATWSTCNVASGPWSGICCSNDGAIAYACQGSWGTGLVYKTTNSGATWSVINNNSHDWQRISCSSDGQVVAVTWYTSGIAVSTNGGSTWSYPSTGGSRWYGVSVSPNGTYIASGIIGETSNTLRVSSNSGSTWTTKNPGYAVQDLVVSNDGTSVTAFETSNNRIVRITVSSAATSVLKSVGVSCSHITSTADGTSIHAIQDLYSTLTTTYHRSLNSGGTWATQDFTVTPKLRVHLRPSPNTPAGWTLGAQTIDGREATVTDDWTTYPAAP